MIWSARRGWGFATLALLAATCAATGCRPEPGLPDGGDASEAISVLDIQTEHDDNSPPELGSVVYLRSVVVTAYDDYAEPRQDRLQRGSEYYCAQDMGYTGGVNVQDAEGGPRSGISLFNPSVIPANQKINPGDLVDVRGEYLEFCLDENNSANSYCQAANTDRLTQLGDATVERVGEIAAPAPWQVLLSEFGRPEWAEDYEGVLVRIDEPLNITACAPTDDRGRPNCCVGDYDRYGNLATDGGISITNEFYSLPAGTTCLSSITGIVTWFFDYNISPRGPEDVVIPESCRGQ